MPEYELHFHTYVRAADWDTAFLHGYKIADALELLGTDWYFTEAYEQEPEDDADDPIRFILDTHQVS